MNQQGDAHLSCVSSSLSAPVHHPAILYRTRTALCSPYCTDSLYHSGVSIYGICVCTGASVSYSLSCLLCLVSCRISRTSLHRSLATPSCTCTFLRPLCPRSSTYSVMRCHAPAPVSTLFSHVSICAYVSNCFGLLSARAILPNAEQYVAAVGADAL